MKKAILGLSVLGLVVFTSCKTDAEKKVEDVQDTQEVIAETTNDATDIAQDEANNALETAANIPAFTSPEAKAFADKFQGWVNELKAASKSGNQEKLNELQPKAVEYMKELQSITQSLTAEDAKKLQDWAQELQNSLNK